MNKKIFALLCIVLFSIPVGVFIADSCRPAIAQETEQPAKQQQIKTWRLPADLQQALVKMVDDFNKEYNTRLEIYKQVLISSAGEFADMPEDAIFDLKSGVFLSKDDYMMLQERAMRLQEQTIKNNKASGEVKKEAQDVEKK